jgi:hypothetical protein
MHGPHLGQALKGALHIQPPTRKRPVLLIAGAGGVLGREVSRRLIGSMAFEHTVVLTHSPFHATMRGVQGHSVVNNDLKQTPTLDAQVGIMMFEPGNSFYDRENSIWTPDPSQVPALAHWMADCGVRTLVMVLPHQPNRLPLALQHGLASLEEHAIASLAFNTLVILRVADSRPAVAPEGSYGERLAGWLLRNLKYMIPSREMPLRASQLAKVVGQIVQQARQVESGTFVAGQELLSRAVHGNADAIIKAWLTSCLAAPQSAAKDATF